MDENKEETEEKHEMKPYLKEVLERIKQKGESRQPVPDKPPEDGIDCPTCHGTGYVKHTDADGHESVSHCPDCYGKRIVHRYLAASGISQEDYDRYLMDNFDPKKSTMAAAMYNLAGDYLADFQSTKKGFGIFGASGMGKTHICIAVCKEITERYHEPHFYFQYRTVMPTLIKAAKGFSTDYDAEMGKWKTRPNLYIDDLFKLAGTVVDGHLIDINSDDLKIMFDLINARYVNGLRTIFSSEYTVHDITAIDEALGSRIYEMIAPYAMSVQGGNERFRGRGK